MPLTIREQSEQLKAAAAERLPADVLEVFDRSIQDFLDRGIPTDSIKAGDVLEPFTLDDATGTPVSLDQIVESGPAVIVFYRGGWCPYCNLALRTYQQELLPQLGRLRCPAGRHQPAVTGRVALHRGEGRPGVHRPLRPGQSSGRSDRHRLRAG